MKAISALSQVNLPKNFIANLIGKGLPAILLVLATPFYLHKLGAEALGLIGLSTLLLNLSNLFDLGFGQTLNREIIRQPKEHVASLIFTFEILYWIAAVILSSLIYFLAPWISHSWLNIEYLSKETAAHCIFYICFSLILQWLFSFYYNCLMGFHKTVHANSIKASIALLNTAATVITLMFYTSVEVLFIWPILTHTLQVVIAKNQVRRSTDPYETKKFDFNFVKESWKYAREVCVVTLCSFLLMNLDKIILSRLLSLEMFGIYNLALVVASSLYLIIFPLFTTLFTRFSHLVSLGDTLSIKNLYQNSFQFITLALFPIGLTIIFFSREILYLWTGDLGISKAAAPIVSIIITGTLLSGYGNIYYALFLGLGLTRNLLYQSLITATFALPLIYGLTHYFGAIGSSFVWILINGSGLLNMHYQLSKNKMSMPIDYYRIFLSITISCTLLFLIKAIPMNSPFTTVCIIIVSIAILSVINLSIFPFTRKWIKRSNAEVDG